MTKRRNDAWLPKWLKAPDAMLQSDSDAKAMLEKYKLPMPNQNLSEVEIGEYIKDFLCADENVKPQQLAAPPTQEKCK